MSDLFWCQTPGCKGMPWNNVDENLGKADVSVGVWSVKQRDTQGALVGRLGCLVSVGFCFPWHTDIIFFPSETPSGVFDFPSF